MIGRRSELIWQAWIEASTKGAVLIFTSAEIDKYATNTFNMSPAAAGMLGGIGGGIAQAYATMGTSQLTLVTDARFLHVHEDC